MSDSTSDTDIYCCESHNPFGDNDGETVDLKFALKKLKTMKGEMKQWHEERRQLEKQAVKLGKELKLLGVKTGKELKGDPLMGHYTREDVRLHKLIDELNDKVVGLEVARRDGRDNHHHRQQRPQQHTSKGRRYVDRKMCEESSSSSSSFHILRSKLRDFVKSNEDTDEQLTRYVEESEEAFSLLSSNFDILRDDNERLQVEIDRLRCMSDDRSLEDKSTDSEQLQAFERALMTEITCVRDQLRLKEAKVTELLKDKRDLELNAVGMERLRGHVDELKGQLERMEQQRDNFERELASEKEKCGKLEGNETLMEDLKRQNTKLEEELGCLREKVDNFEAHHQELAERVKIIPGLQEKLRKSENSLTVEKLQVEKLTKELLISTSQREELELVKSDLEGEVLAKRAAVAQLELSKCDLEEQKHLNSSMKSEIDELKRTISTCETVMSQLHGQSRVLVDANEKLKADLCSSCETLRKLNSCNDELNEQVDKLKVENCDVKEELDKLQDSSDRLTSENQGLRSERNKLRQAISSLEGKTQELLAENLNLRNRSSSLQRDLDKFREANVGLESQLACLREQLERAKLDNCEAVIEADRWRREVDECKCQLDRCRDERDALLGDNEKLTRQKSDFLKRVSDLENDNSKLKGEASMAQRTTAELEALNKVREESISAMELEKRELLGELSRLRGEVDESSRQFLDLETARCKIAEERAAMGMERCALIAELEKCRVERERAKVELFDFKRRLNKAEIGEAISVDLLGKRSTKEEAPAKLQAANGGSTGDVNFNDDDENNNDNNSTSLLVNCQCELSRAKQQLDNCNRVIEELDKRIDGQKQAIRRIHDYINYANGSVTSKPKMALSLDDDDGVVEVEVEEAVGRCGGDHCIRNNSALRRLVKKSLGLSGAIFKVEREIQRIDGPLNERQEPTSWMEESAFDPV